MDNDILWVWQSFGFLSAVEQAKETILHLHTEVKSNPRLCIIQLFGSDSGFVVSHAALASGVCDAVLIPEVRFSMEGLSRYIRKKLKDRTNEQMGIIERRKGSYGMIVMAETAIPTDINRYLEDSEVSRRVDLTTEEKDAIRTYEGNDRRVFGQTPDPLRSGGLKIVSRVLQDDIRKEMKASMKDEYWSQFRVFANEPRHQIRSINPSTSDIIIGKRLGVLAVDCAMAGYSDFMISQWLTEYVMVPLELVILGRKRIPRTGIFWKSVLANTGQPAELEIVNKE